MRCLAEGEDAGSNDPQARNDRHHELNDTSLLVKALEEQGHNNRNDRGDDAQDRLPQILVILVGIAERLDARKQQNHARAKEAHRRRVDREVVARAYQEGWLHSRALRKGRLWVRTKSARFRQPRPALCQLLAHRLVAVAERGEREAEPSLQWEEAGMSKPRREVTSPSGGRRGRGAQRAK